MRRALRKASAVAVAAIGLTLVDTSAQAGSTSIGDASGVDFDAACSVDLTLAGPPANSYASPVGTGCAGISAYDSSTEGLDLNHQTSAATLASNAAGQLVASWTFDGAIPCAGCTSFFGYDLPAVGFTGGTYYMLFQNKTIQRNAKYTGCPQIPPRPTPVVNRFGSWKDGYHFFVAFSVNWDGLRWVYSAQLGQYEPGPNGGLEFFELGTNDGFGWRPANVFHPYGSGPDGWNVTISSLSPTTVTVTAPGVYKEPDTENCSNGHFDYWFAKPGDVIANVKGLTVANRVATLPFTVPVSATCGLSGGVLCLNDIRTVGGYVRFSDTTHGNSTRGIFGRNTEHIAYSPGLARTAEVPTVAEQWSPLCHLLERPFCLGLVHFVPDTLGPGPTCPWNTFGGLLPENPLWTVDTPCEIDDDFVARGSFLPEFWDTPYGFVV